jgi:hypothetical protein
MKKDSRKLILSRETLIRLNGSDLGQVAGGSGGGWSDQSVCPTTDASVCKRCY